MFMASPFRQNLPYFETGQREAQEAPPAFLFGLLHHLYHLRPEQDEAVVDDFVVVVAYRVSYVQPRKKHKLPSGKKSFFIHSANCCPEWTASEKSAGSCSAG